MIAGVREGSERNTVWQAAFPTSFDYGNGDHSVTEPGEIDAVVAAFDSASSDAAAASRAGGLSKDNRTRVDLALHARVHDGDYIRQVSDGSVYYYSGGTLTGISAAFATAAGINPNTAKRITSSAMTGWTRGADAAYPTSWRYDGSDHAVNTDNELSQLQLALEDADSTSFDAL
jgi:hypothetical protein